MREMLILAGVALAASAAGALAWLHYAPRSFWLVAVFPFRAAHLYLTWAHVASGCRLTIRRRRWRWTLEAVPVTGTLSRATGAAMTVTGKRRVRRVDIERAPKLGVPRPGALGWRSASSSVTARSPPTTPTPANLSPTPGTSMRYE
jgi:hypothetical protein